MIGFLDEAYITIFINHDRVNSFRFRLVILVGVIAGENRGLSVNDASSKEGEECSEHYVLPSMGVLLYLNTPYCSRNVAVVSS